VTSTPAAVSEPKPSFRHLAWLAGPWAILWFEVAVLRRANYQRWSLFVLVVSSLLTGGFAPEFVPLFAFVGPLGAVTGAYLSGVARHLRLRTLVLVPGRTVSRVVAAEALHAVFVGIGLALVAAGGAGVVVATSWVATKLDVPFLMASTVLLVVASGLLAGAISLLGDRIEARHPCAAPGPAAPGSDQRGSGSASSRSATSSTAATTGLSGS
jgi:sporulation killing factor system integral membrane protein